MPYRYLYFAVIFCCIFIASHAYAACSSPVGKAGEMGFNITGSGQYEYCNDTSWAMIPNSNPAATNETLFASDSHTCSIATNGTGYCWGLGTMGRLGNNSTASQDEPVEVHTGEGPGTFTQLNSSSAHACGVASDGKAYCWGQGSDGKLGNNSSANQDEPVEVHAGEGPGTFTQVSAGSNHTCGIATNDKAYCWGDDFDGLLGNGGPDTNQDEPVEVHTGEGPGTFTQVTVGEVHTCGLASNNKAYCWGHGGDNALGNGTDTTDQDEPVEVHAGESPGTFTQIDAGDYHVCAIGTNNKAYCWGHGFFGRSGTNDEIIHPEPVEVHDGENTGGTFTQISAGLDHSCAIGTDGKAYCFGRGLYGRLGNNDVSATNQLEPVEVHAGESPGTFTAVTAGDEHSCGIATDGKAYCWGQGANGRLGNDSTTDQGEPVEVHAGEGSGDFNAEGCTMASEMDFNSTSYSFEFCDGSTVYNISDTAGMGGPGCPATGSLDAGAPGAMQYNTTTNKMVFCGGANWIDIPN
jgi:alpha-tubulin suppressor-like RCC1 family protein